MVQAPKRPYALLPAFESSVLFHLSSSKRFWAALGEGIEADLFSGEPQRLIADSAAALHREGFAATPTLTLQRILRTHAEGGVKRAVFLAAAALVDSWEDVAPLPLDAVISEFSPMIRARLSAEGVHELLDLWGKKGDLDPALSKLKRGASIGLVDVGEGYKVGPGMWSSVTGVRHSVTLATGVPDLDAIMDGLPAAGITVFIGNTGAGKSIALNHIFAHSIASGVPSIYVSLEVDARLEAARLMAALSGCPTNAILNDPQERASASAFLALQSLAPGYIQEFTPDVATWADITDCIERLEEEVGVQFAGVFVDYADLIAPPPDSKGRSAKAGTYATQGEVYREMDGWIRGRGGWLATASQGKNRDKGKGRGKLMDESDMADSIKKGRIAHALISLMTEGDGQERMVTAFLAKHRTAEARILTPPFANGFAFGRLSLELGSWPGMRGSAADLAAASASSVPGWGEVI